MIRHLKGKITYKDIKSFTLENQGIGYKIFCSPGNLKKISKGEEVKIFTYLHLKEDAIELYGFLTQEELGLFETLNGISGIGPKTALMLASLGSLEKLKEVMEKGSLPPEVKGIGQKKMQKILLELTGKIKEMKINREDSSDEALDALISLGFTQQKAKDALSAVPKDLSQEERIKKSLKFLGHS